MLFMKVEALMDAAVNVVFAVPAFLSDLFDGDSGEMFIAPDSAADDAFELICWNVKRVIL